MFKKFQIQTIQVVDPGEFQTKITDKKGDTHPLSNHKEISLVVRCHNF